MTGVARSLVRGRVIIDRARRGRDGDIRLEDRALAALHIARLTARVDHIHMVAAAHRQGGADFLVRGRCAAHGVRANLILLTRIPAIESAFGVAVIERCDLAASVAAVVLLPAK